MQVRGALETAAKTATNPKLGKRPGGAIKNLPITLPKVAPMKKSGVTMPPLNPLPREIAVKRVFHHQLKFPAPVAANEDNVVTALGSVENMPRLK